MRSGPPPPNDPAASLAAIHDAARAAVARGWSVIPLAPRTKEPTLPGWPALALTSEQVSRYFALQVSERQVPGFPTGRAAPNLGVRTGAASGGLVDVDADTPEAVALAHDLLPPTGRISGHASKPASHLWYAVAPGSGGITRLAFMGVPVPAMHGASPLPAMNGRGTDGGVNASETVPGQDRTPVVHDRGAAMLIELRGDGHQTMIPPSIHPSGEPVVWAREGDPARVDLAVLRAGVATVAAGAQLARAWPAVGLRDEAALALCGMLARGGWDAGRIDAFVQAVARAAGDEEWARRGKGRHTHQRLAANQPVNGTQRLAEVLGGGELALGQAIVARVREWLGLPGGTLCGGCKECKALTPAWATPPTPWT